MSNPSKQTIRNWLDEDVTKWFLENLSEELINIDTVRNIESEGNLEARCLGRKWALDAIENALGPIIGEGELHQLAQNQKESPVINLKEESK